MGDGTKENPLTREDVLRLIKENGGTAKGLDLSEKIFEEGIDLHGLNLKGIILKEAILWDIKREAPFSRDLNQAYLEGAHFEGALLVDAHLEGAHFIGVKLSSDTLLEGANWGNYILGEEREGHFGLAADSYRQLKQWHTNAGMYNIAGKFFYREMEAKRKTIQWWPNPLPKIRQTLYWLLYGYGEIPWRVFASAAVVVLGLALIYFAIGTLTPSTFLNSLYYSAVSFTALGYGSWAPEPFGWVKGLGAAEAFAGVFMMALFLITFTRKMTR